MEYQTMVDDQNLDTNIHKQLDRLKPFLVSEKLAAANRALVDAGLRKIAALSLLAAQRELRQMERPVSPEEFTAEVLDSYGNRYGSLHESAQCGRNRKRRRHWRGRQREVRGYYEDVFEN